MRRTLTIILSSAVVIAGFAIASLHVSAQAPAQKTGNLILRGDSDFTRTAPMVADLLRTRISRKQV